jgi:hypothetical protein
MSDLNALLAKDAKRPVPMKVAGEQNLYQQIHNSYGKTALSFHLAAVQSGLLLFAT